MTETKKIIITIDTHQIAAYHTLEGEIVLTRRQIGEAVGKTKATAQRFFTQHENELPLPIKASIPERKGKIPLTPWLGAFAYWQYQANLGNQTAQTLCSIISKTTITNNHIKVIEEETPESIPNKTITEPDLTLQAQGIDIAANWMLDAGIDKKAIASWKLEELKKQVPELTGIVDSAQELIASESHSPTGMITSQLASELSQKLGKKITAAKVNLALHENNLQEWAKPGINRERKLTQRGLEYGIALLTTSSEGWQGAQLRWYPSVIPLLVEYFSSLEDSN